jgi:hypothetical protein
VGGGDVAAAGVTWAPRHLERVHEDIDASVMAVASQPEVGLVALREATWRDTACRIANRQLTEDKWARLLPDRPYAPSCA